MTRPFIGVDEVVVPDWATGYASAADAGLRALVRDLPATLTFIAREAWAASRPLTLAAGSARLASGAVTAFGLLATADAFTGLLDGGTPLVAALPALIAVVVAFALRGLLDSVVSAITGALAPLVEARARDRLAAAALAVQSAAFDDAEFTDLLGRACTEAPDEFKAAVTDAGEILGSAVTSAASVVTAAVLHPLLAPLVLLSAVPRAWASARSARVAFASYVRVVSHRKRIGITAALTTDREAAAEIRACGARGLLLDEHRRIAARLTAEAVRTSNRREALLLAGRALSGIGTGAAYLALFLLVSHGVLPLAVAGAAVVAMRAASGGATQAVQEANNLYQVSLTLHVFRSCLERAAAHRRAPGSVEAPDPEEVVLDEVTFSYPDAVEPAVRAVSATLRRGQVVALVGENGSGKTTLSKLISGLYLPTGGAVRWNGVDIASVDEDALNDRVAMVMQAPLRWPSSAADNIRVGRIGRADPEDAHFAAAARDSGADRVAQTLPNGWETLLSRLFATGHDLSGGQWQRLSVARGLYRDAPLVIADEPTAALDARAEHAVFAALRDLGGRDKITVLITHRLANIRTVDLILVMHEGRLAQVGTHVTLMAEPGHYRDLYEIQADAYDAGVSR
ncbi:ABC transporter ATP-binding protein [Actinokineospora bangkokensis]|uniref:ABC transporter n=1 Tax=Actinokineospora bangkokensis TaxID=1193682 RepID=A0A1Q9LL91_9PSEU|nr:ABC transporter ATP-binding protein [Actinokineospora bangkokensis]OLR92807.1 hypothetical protein BJP25_19450 [Actinokineospora bangkokensis]